MSEILNIKLLGGNMQQKNDRYKVTNYQNKIRFKSNFNKPKSTQLTPA